MKVEIVLVGGPQDGRVLVFEVKPGSDQAPEDIVVQVPGRGPVPQAADLGRDRGGHHLVHDWISGHVPLDGGLTMARHRRPRPVRWLVTRRRHRALLETYEALLAEYLILQEDHQRVLEDHEGLLYDLERARPRHIPSWATTEEIPALDPDKAGALVRRTDLLRSPAGAWERTAPGTTG